MDAREIERTVVVGGGLMGAGLAHILAQGGCRVRVVDLTDQLLEMCLRRLREDLVTFVQSGLLSEEQAATIAGRIEATTSLDAAVADAQFVVEAVVERLEVKQEVFERLDRLAPRDAILATNTSGLSVGEIAERVRHQERVVGSHFFYPHTIIPLVEVVYGPGTSDETVATTVALWKRCGKEALVCRKDVRGFVVNRLQLALAREAISMVGKGIASAADVDRAMRLGMGLRMPLWGILEQRDWSGLRIHQGTTTTIYPTLENASGPLPILLEKLERGDLGVQTGKGFFDWTGKDVEALRRKKQRQLIRMVKAVKEIMPEEEDLVDNP